MEAHEVAFYQTLAAEHRGTSRQVGAWSPENQVRRYEVLFDVLESMLGGRMHGMSLLDFGCGRGDLATWLARTGRMDVLRYVGVDAIEENVEDARAMGVDARLVRWNGEGRVVDDDIDLIVFSGTFATTSIERRTAMLRALLDQARVGVAGNYLCWTPGVRDWGEAMILVEPADALAAIDRHRFRVQLRADYLPHDFTVGAIRWDGD